MLQNEFLRFSQTLKADSMPDNVRKISNLVSLHLDGIVPLGTHQGLRVKHIVKLAQEQWNLLSSDIQPLPDQRTEYTSTINRLKSMSVGPFRGFSRAEMFDLDSNIVLLYGPNGTGKSSFCEALEYKLLGSVAEAESKRFRNQSDYFKNAYTNEFLEPEIIGVGAQGQEIPVESNEALYRFCFIEKNRIDSFSRIAALAPAKQTELISTLFGLDEFNSFVKNFTSDIDAKYIDLIGAKATELEKKRQSLIGASQQIKKNIIDLETRTAEEKALALKYRQDISFNQMVIDIRGDENNLGVIKQLELELEKQSPSKSNLTCEILQKRASCINSNYIDLKDKRRKLEAESQNISFQNLFEAVVKLQSGNPNECPACHTPLTQTAKNPYIYASEELLKLEFLSTLQKGIAELEQKINEQIQDISRTIHICCQFYPESNALERFKNKTGIELWSELQPSFEGDVDYWNIVEIQVQQLEERDKDIDETIKLRETKIKRLKELQGLDKEITIFQTKRESKEQENRVLQKQIDDFDKENEQLIESVDKEKDLIKTNNEISEAYSQFVTLLNDYKEGLPERLIANLGETIVTLYNSFNRNDSTSEKLSDIKLPLMQNQRLEVSFLNNPDKYFDALHILSEGHVRCIGLAILLAKNINEKCPFLIFDDPVNAIDDDHRESIRRTLFDDDFFSEKQIILACHGEEFFKDIQNLLSVQSVRQSKTFSFLPRLGESHIRVDFNCSSRNYIISAREHYERNEIRDALSKCRQSLESLMKGKVWNYVNRHGDGNLSLKFRSSKSPIELRNLSEQLKKQINKPDFDNQNKNIILTPICTLLGISGESREWRYLNKGTHEESDRAEFDRGTVNIIISALEEIEQEINR